MSFKLLVLNLLAISVRSELFGRQTRTKQFIPPHDKKDFSNENLIVSRPDPEDVQLGASASFYCQLPDVASTIELCQVVSPSGGVLDVKDGIVTDSFGAPVPGYLQLDNGDPLGFKHG